MGLVSAFTPREYNKFFIITVLVRLFRSTMALSLFMVTDVLTHDIAFAGLVGCASALGGAVGSVIAVRLYAVVGLMRTIAASMVVFALAGGFIYHGLRVGNNSMVVGATIVYGLCYPSCDTVARYALSHFIPAGPLRNKAFTWDALSFDIAYTVSPTVAALLANSHHPLWAVLIATAGVVVMTCVFLMVKQIRSLDRIDAISEDKPYRVPPFLWFLVVSQLLLSCAVGAVELMMQDVGEGMGRGHWVGIILGSWSVFSVAGGYLIEKFYRVVNKVKTLGVVFVLMGAAFIPMKFFVGWTVDQKLGGMLVMFAISGIPFAYAIGLSYSLLDDIFPAQTPAKYFAWMSTAPALGYAFGLLCGGKIGEHYGPFNQIGISGIIMVAVGLVFIARYCWNKHIPQAQLQAI